MKSIFSYDSILFQAINKLLDSIALCLLWALFSIPVFTMGAATTALFYTADKVIFREEGKLMASFWHAFKQNLKQATVIGLLLGVLLIFLYFEIFYSYTLYSGGYLHISMFLIISIVTALLLMWACYLFPYAARYSDKTKQIFKNCAIMALSNLQWSVLLLTVVCASIFLFSAIPGGFLLAPVGGFMTVSRITNRVFRRYEQAEEAAQQNGLQEGME